MNMSTLTKIWTHAESLAQMRLFKWCPSLLQSVLLTMLKLMLEEVFLPRSENEVLTSIDTLQRYLLHTENSEIALHRLRRFALQSYAGANKQSLITELDPVSVYIQYCVS